MRKWLTCLLIVLLAFSALTVVAFAADSGVSVTVEASTSSFTLNSSSDTYDLTLTFKVHNDTGKGIMALTFDVPHQKGFTYQSAETVEVGTMQSVNENQDSNYRYVYTSSDGNTKKDWTAYTLKLKVTNEAAKEEGSTSFTANKVTLGLKDGDGNSVTFSCTPASITVKHADGAHKWVDGSVTLAATCTTTGTQEQNCTCGKKNTKILEAKGHSITEEPVFKFDGATKDDSKVEVTVKCTNANCDLGLYNGGNGKKITLTEGNEKNYLKVEKVTKGGASCTQAGNIAWKATLTIPDKDDTSIVKTGESSPIPVDKLGHDWGEPHWQWDTNDPDNATATLTVNCKREGCQYKSTAFTKTVTKVDVDGDKTESTNRTAPQCEKAGSIDWKATVKDPDKDGEFTNDMKDVPIPATGHDWKDTTEEPVWVNVNGDHLDAYPTVTAVVKCQNNGACDKNYDTTGLTLTGTVKRDPYTAPTCTTGGEATFTATFTTAGASTGTEEAKTYSATTTESYAAMGHDFGENKPVVSPWPEIAADGKSDPTVEKENVTLTCNTCKEAVPAKDTVTVNQVGKDSDTTKWKDPTYVDKGLRTYTVSAVFDDGKGTQTESKTSDEHTYELPQLKTPEAAASVTDSNGIVSDSTTAQDTVKEAVDAAVKSALANGTATGLDDAFAQKVKEAGGGNGEGDEVMTISTVLEVKEKGTVPPKETPNQADALGLPGATAGQYCGIDIKVTVNGGDSHSVSDEVGYISEISEPIQFKFPVSEAGSGKIVFVARYHDGKWAKLETKLSGNDLVFESKQFSAFAAASSNSIAYADVTGLSDVTYNGKAQTPKPKVTILTSDGEKTLTEGVDYDLEYQSNTEVGTAKIIIKAKEGNDYALTDSQEVTFRIVKAPATGSGSGKTPTAPATGDETPLALYAGVVTACAAALAVVFALRRKRQK